MKFCCLFVITFNSQATLPQLRNDYFLVLKYCSKSWTPWPACLRRFSGFSAPCLNERARCQASAELRDEPVVWFRCFGTVKHKVAQEQTENHCLREQYKSRRNVWLPSLVKSCKYVSSLKWPTALSPHPAWCRCGLTRQQHFNSYDSQAQPNWLYASITVHRPTVAFKFDRTLILHTQNCPLQCVIITNKSDNFVTWHAFNYVKPSLATPDTQKLIQPLIPGNDNTYAITQHKDIPNLRYYTYIMIYKSNILTSPVIYLY